MTASPEWERAYASSARYHVPCIEPYFQNLIQNYVNRSLVGQKILEFGAGTGANIEALINLGADYHGIEASESAVAVLRTRFNGTEEKVHCGDFTKEQPFGNDFDVVIDRASVPHNDTQGIYAAVDSAFSALKPGGLFIGCDWFSASHSECNVSRGTQIEAGTFTGYKDGQFAGIGKVHFFSEAQIAELFIEFDSVFLQERVFRRPKPGMFYKTTADPHWISQAFKDSEYRSALWDIVVRRPV